MAGVAAADLAKRPSLDLGAVAVAVRWAALPKLSVEPELERREDGQTVPRVEDGGGDLTPAGPCAFFFTEIVDGQVRTAQDRVHEYVGLISGLSSLLVAYEHIEDYELVLPGGLVEPTPVLRIDPLRFDAPSMTPDDAKRWRLAADALESTPDRERVALSLRWFDEAKRHREVDAFLRFWFALETLAMRRRRRTSRPSKPRLSRSTGSTATRRNFGIARIYGLRSPRDDGGRLVGILGTMGGKVHTQIHVQVLLRLLERRAAQQAVDAPRWIVGGMEIGERDDVIRVEEPCDASARATLRTVTVPRRPTRRQARDAGRAH
jgi:hypothetical protein